MTVQDLLRHTSGLAYGEITQNAPVKEGLEKAGALSPGHWTSTRATSTPDEQIAGLANVPLAYQPGTSWNYSVSTDMLGRVVEKASGKRLADFLEERLFKPLRHEGLGLLGAGGQDVARRRVAGEGPLRRPRVPADRRLRAAEERFGRRGRRVDRGGLPALLAR